jgi:hypothetical protein
MPQFRTKLSRDSSVGIVTGLQAGRPRRCRGSIHGRAKRYFSCLQRPELLWGPPSVLYREDFYFVDRLHGSALHGERCAASHEEHMNFADESAGLTADNIWNKVFTINRSLEVLKMLSSLPVDIFCN